MEGLTEPRSPTGESFEALEKTPGCISVAITSWSPPIVDLTTRPYSGFHVELFRVIMHKLRWCYYFVEPPDKKLGLKENGSFTGATGMIERGEVDMLMGPLGQESSRADVMHFAYGYFQSGSSFIYRRITHIQPDMFILAKPYFNQVWLATLATVAVVVLTATLLNHLHDRQHSGGSRAGESERPEGQSVFSRTFIWTWKILLAQDLADTPRGDAGHILAIFWLLVSFALASMYRCNLKAILINDKIKLPFTNAEEFANQNEYPLTWINGKVYTPYYKAHSVLSPHEAIGKMWGKRTDLIRPDEVMTTALSRKIAVVDVTLGALSYIAEDFSEFGECRVTLADSGVTKVYMTFAFPKNTTLRDDFDMVLLRLFQAGIPQQLQYMSLLNASWCLQPDTKHGSRAIAVTDLLGIFIICGLGLASGLVIFCLELASHGRSSKSRMAHLSSGSSSAASHVR